MSNVSFASFYYLDPDSFASKNLFDKQLKEPYTDCNYGVLNPNTPQNPALNIRAGFYLVNFKIKII